MGKRSTPAEAFGAVLRELRVERGMTQDLLAEKAGTERSHISALERAEKGPSLGTILSLAEALDVPPGSLLDRVHKRLKAKSD